MYIFYADYQTKQSMKLMLNLISLGSAINIKIMSVIATNEIRSSIDIAEQFLSYEDGPQSDEMYSLIQRLQTMILSNPPKQKQTNIKDYFG